MTFIAICRCCSMNTKIICYFNVSNLLNCCCNHCCCCCCCFCNNCYFCKLCYSCCCAILVKSLIALICPAEAATQSPGSHSTTHPLLMWPLTCGMPLRPPPLIARFRSLAFFSFADDFFHVCLLSVRLLVASHAFFGEFLTLTAVVVCVCMLVRCSDHQHQFAKLQQ